MMGRAAGAALLILVLVLTGPAQGAHYTPPGKPKLTSCRSPEKETFTCWWEPGADGDLPTTYALYYRKENSETVYECPDYHTAGENSCFFNKNDTSIWINYNITVVATNALGSNFSDPANVDVVYIVQPHTPENVTAAVIEDKDGPFLRVSWEPPRKADTRSGWITLIYELRVKLEGEEDWEEHHAGQQKVFNIFSLRSGGAYMVQVRCRPDHGFWSEWSATTYIKVPDYIPREKSVWILMAIFSAFIFLILTWILNMKSHSVKHCILPPVPSPKIKGFDKQLLKSGRSEDVFNALVVPGFPPTISSDYEDLLVENLEVCIPEEQGLTLEEGKDLQEGCLKSKGSPSDSDSGRGSCDSHTLLMEKCGEGEAKEDEGDAEEEEGNRRTKGRQRQQAAWEEGEVSQAQGQRVSSALCDGRVKTWPSVFSPLPQYSSRPLGQQGSLEMTKQLCLSDGLFPPPSAVSHPAQLRHSAKDGLAVEPGLGAFRLGNKPPQQLPFKPHWHLQAHSEFNISSMEHKRTAGLLHLPPSRSMEYVEVQRVKQENMVLLQPLSPDHGRRGAGHPPISQGEDYSKVKGVDSDNVLLLQREVKVVHEGDRCPCDNQGTINGATCYTAVTSPTVTTTRLSGKPTVCAPTAAIPDQEGMVMAANGYVDTATMLPAF